MIALLFAALAYGDSAEKIVMIFSFHGSGINDLGTDEATMFAKNRFLEMAQGLAKKAGTQFVILTPSASPTLQVGEFGTFYKGLPPGTNQAILSLHGYPYGLMLLNNALNEAGQDVDAQEWPEHGGHRRIILFSDGWTEKKEDDVDEIMRRVQSLVNPSHGFNGDRDYAIFERVDVYGFNLSKKSLQGLKNLAASGRGTFELISMPNPRGSSSSSPSPVTDVSPSAEASPIPLPPSEISFHQDPAAR